MNVKEILTGLPWWVKWVAIPAVALVVFGGMLMSILSWIIALLFKALVFVVLVAGLIYVVRKVTSSSGSSGSGGGW